MLLVVLLSADFVHDDLVVLVVVVLLFFAEGGDSTTTIDGVLFGLIDFSSTCKNSILPQGSLYQITAAGTTTKSNGLVLNNPPIYSYY